MNSQFLSKLKAEKLTNDIISHIEQYSYEQIKQNNLSKLKNDVKLRAVQTTKTYEEFKDLVDAAELIPIDKSDKMNAKTKKCIWNTSAIS